MNFKQWLIIKDDSKRSYEVVGQVMVDNAFSNKVIAMQREGMSVTSVLLPVGSSNPSKESIKFSGFTREDGLYERLCNEHRAIMMKHDGHWE
jgi:hypothetical protein